MQPLYLSASKKWLHRCKRLQEEMCRQCEKHPNPLLRQTRMTHAPHWRLSPELCWPRTLSDPPSRACADYDAFGLRTIVIRPDHIVDGRSPEAYAHRYGRTMAEAVGDPVPG